MYTIYFNDSLNGIQITSFNRNTNFGPEGASSTAYFNVHYSGNEAPALYGAADAEITALTIKKDDTTIYALTDISANITSINEYLSGDWMEASVNINFNFGEN